MNTAEQITAILRYHRRLGRLGRMMSLEQAAAEWIGRFAKLWREHQDRGDDV